MEKLLIFLLLKGRREYFNIIRFKGGNYKVTITKFIPVTEWMSKMEKALQNAEPKLEPKKTSRSQQEEKTLLLDPEVIFRTVQKAIHDRTEGHPK